MLLFVKNVAFLGQNNKKKCIAKKRFAIHLEYYFFSSS